MSEVPSTMPQSWPWGSLYIINLNNFIWTIESDWKLLTFESADITTKWYKLLLKISRWFIVLLFWFFCVIPVQKWYCQIDRFRNCLWKMMSNFRNSSIYRIIIWQKMKSTPILKTSNVDTTNMKAYPVYQVLAPNLSKLEKIGLRQVFYC